MSVKQTCDLCDQPAIDTLVIESKTTTKIERDVCVEHLALYKKLMRAFVGQDLVTVDAVVAEAVDSGLVKDAG
jgi:hypothetical protein